MADVRAYLSLLLALLPPGRAWPREAGARLVRLLEAEADELARVEDRGGDLHREADPRTTLELLPDWERVAGLPDPCVGEAQTTQARRDALVQRLTARGGQSQGYFIGVAARLGYAITITEFQPFRAGMSRAGDPLTNGDWRFTWRVNGEEETVRAFAAGDGAAGEPLRSWGNEPLECTLARLKPAHTLVQFAYGGDA